MNRAETLKQADYVIPTYSLLTWTPQTASFVRPLIYGYKGGRAALASEKLATLFLNERGPVEKSVLVSAPSKAFDHSVLWTQELARQAKWPAIAALDDKTSRAERQKELQAGERGLRRFVLKEHFAYPYDPVSDAKRIVFADDVVTSGSTAMAAYMALGDPEHFEVWSLVARPRLATKQGAC